MYFQWNLLIRDAFADRYACGDELVLDADSRCRRFIDFLTNPDLVAEYGDECDLDTED